MGKRRADHWRALRSRVDLGLEPEQEDLRSRESGIASVTKGLGNTNSRVSGCRVMKTIECNREMTTFSGLRIDWVHLYESLAL